MATAEQVSSFKEITGEKNDELVRSLLEACENNLERAIELHFARGADAANGAMQVDDDDDDVEVVDQVAPPADAPIVLGDEDEEGVRRPIQPVRGRLVDQSYEQYYGGPSRRAHPVFEQFRDATSSSGLHRYPGDHRFGVPENRATDRRTRQQQKLAEMFRPPVDILTHSDWDSLLQTGRTRGRWVLVNLQDPGEFECQVLNRDVWSNATLKEVIKEGLLFWQAYVNTSEGRRVSAYHQLTQPSPPSGAQSRGQRDDHRAYVNGRQKRSQSRSSVSDFLARYPTFEARDREFVHSAAPAVENAAIPEASTSGTNGVSNGKRKEPLDVDTPDYQAKRLKKELNIDDEVEVVEKKEEKPKLELGPWESYVAPSTSDSKEIVLVLRLPNGERHNLKLNDKCPLKAVFAFVESHGLPASEVTLILTYPKREYDLSAAHLTLGDLEFARQEMIHVDRVL
ncbi:UBX domain-containing protein 7 [Aphelenchoides fujianensis]|nr:UBX domain-containing protein 7 [Aphelenchoides fujianensis]